MVARGDAETLCRTVTSLRAAEYRTACSMMREAEFWEPLPDEDAFWKFARHFLPHDNKAFLGTFLRAAARIHLHRPMAFRSQAFDDFLAQCLTPIDCRKTIEAFAPLMVSPESLAAFLALLLKNDLVAFFRAVFLLLVRRSEIFAANRKMVCLGRCLHRPK